MRVLITALGCKLNQAEIEALARQFRAAGHQLVDELAVADLHVVNSCSVTAEAARASRQVARRGGRLARAVPTVMTGCHASEGAPPAGIDLMVPNPDKERLVELVHAAFPELAPGAAAPFETDSPYAPLPHGSTRSLVKVEDGCDMHCAFCIIPRTRGRQRSRPVAAVVAEVAGLAAAGYREVVLTGVQISAYRDGSARLAQLVAAILGETAVERLRLTSIAPWQVDPRLVTLFASEWGTGGRRRLCRHLHLSLQSGDDATLRRMRRPYTTDGYAQAAAALRASIPGLALTTDVIVGFPGEAAAEHAASLAFVERQAFAAVHVFPFSPRPQTEAAALPGPIAPATVAARHRAMSAVADGAAAAWAADHVGSTVDVLWEGVRGGRRQGLTDTYLRTLAPGAATVRNTVSPVRIVRTEGAVAIGEPLAAVAAPA
jgi:threonylcarbamoyladenosine tRNA methylthiotransferase MtaB